MRLQFGLIIGYTLLLKSWEVTVTADRRSYSRDPVRSIDVIRYIPYDAGQSEGTMP